MGNLNKVVYTDHQTVITASNLNAIQDSVVQNTSYTTCSTGASTAAKTAALTDFVLTTGSAVKVKFTNTNTASNPTLNVNSTGAKPIMQYGNTACGTNENTSWSDGAVVEFIYDGTNWVMQGKNISETGIFKKPVYVDAENGTTTTVGTSTLWVGNGAAEGTAGNSKGQVVIYGNGEKYVNIQATNATGNRTVELPDENGTLMSNKGGTFVGNVAVDRANGTTSANGTSSIILGNDTPSGAAGNSYGRVQLYGTGSNYGVLLAQSVTANREVQIPNASGTIALTDDVGFINKGHISIGGALTDIENWIKSNLVSNRWIVARVTPTSSGYFGSSSFDIMANCSSANYGWGYVHSDNPTNGGHLYFRLGAGIFDWRIVTTNPLNNDGGAIQLTVTRTQNSFANADSLARVSAWKKSGILFCNFNFSVTTGGSFPNDVVEIARISGWNACSSTYICIAGQSTSSQTLLAYINAVGTIYIYSGQTITPQFFRAFFTVPSAD